MHTNPPSLVDSSTGVEGHTQSWCYHHGQDKEQGHPLPPPPSYSLVIFLRQGCPSYSCGSIVNLMVWFGVTELILFPTFATKASIYFALRTSHLLRAPCYAPGLGGASAPFYPLVSQGWTPRGLYSVVG